MVSVFHRFLSSVISNGKDMDPDSDYSRTIRKVSVLSMAGNLALAGFKFFAGFVGRSDAMISDAIHSSSDIAGSLIVLEAGGKVMMPLAGDGMDYSLTTCVLAAAPQCMEQALKLFRKHT